jgi:hypothetical protein
MSMLRGEPAFLPSCPEYRRSYIAFNKNE